MTSQASTQPAAGGPGQAAPLAVTADDTAAILIDAARTGPEERDIIHAYELTGEATADAGDWTLEAALCFALQRGAVRTWQPGPSRHDLRITVEGRTVCLDARAPLTLVRPAYGQ